MVFNKFMQGFSDIFLVFLQLAVEIYIFFKLRKMAFFWKFFSLKENYPKTMKNIINILHSF